MKPSKKKALRKKLLRGTKGAISILLCLLLMPFLSTSLALVEYGRYQQVAELVNELEELTGISLLSDYDQYIHNRFGLLSVSQKQSLKNNANGYLSANAKTLGKQATLENITASGSLTLNDTNVLRRQILDVAEFTAPAQVLVEDFNLDELMNAFTGLKNITDMIDMVGNIADLTDHLKNAINTASTLKTNLETIRDAVYNLESEANTLSTLIYNFYKNISENGYSFPDTLSGEELDAILLSLCGDYQAEVTAIYESAQKMVGYIKTVTSTAPKIAQNLTDLTTHVENVISSAEKIGQTGESKTSSVASDAGTSLVDVSKEIEKLLTDVKESVKQEVINSAKTTAQEILNTTLKDLGIADVSNRLYLISRNEYFNSDTAKEDMKDLISLIPDVWNTQSPTTVLNMLKEKLVPDINLNLGTIIKDIGDVVSNATSKLESNIDQKFFETITKLVNIIKNLFKLNVFYDMDLNAFVNLGSRETGPYQGFLNALSNALTAIDNFVNSMKKGDWLGMLKSIWNLCDSIRIFLETLVNIIKQTVGSFMEIAKGFINGNGISTIYERLLIAGYAVHNFPNRNHASRSIESEYNGSESKFRTILDGQGMTGFSYNDIARPYQYVGKNDPNRGINGLVTLMNNLKNGHGSDTMFKGAEMEYILAATNSEVLNQTIVFFNLYFIRLVCNLPAVFLDGEVTSLAAAANVACWVVYILYALIEPFCDCLLLVNDQSVPVIKFDCYMTTSGLDNFLKKLADGCMSEALQNSMKDLVKNSGSSGGGSSGSSGSGGTGGGGSGGGDSGGAASGLADDLLAVDYTSHLLIMAVMNMSSEKIVERIQALIRLETSEYYRQRNITFSMDKTYTTITVKADVQFHPFIDLAVFTGGEGWSFDQKIGQTVSY